MLVLVGTMRILHRLEREGTVPTGALRVIAQREVQGYPWVARIALGAPAITAIRSAFTAIEDAILLDLMRARRYTAVTAADYEDVRRDAARLGLLAVS